MTGAGNGTFEACALSLAAHGASVVVNDLGTSEFRAGGERERGRLHLRRDRRRRGSAAASHDSVGDAAGCAAAVATVQVAYGRVDILVGCGGALLEANLHATDDEYQRFLGLFLSQKSGSRVAWYPGWSSAGGGGS